MHEAELHHDVDPLAAAAVLLREDSDRDDSDVTPMKLHKLLYIAQANYLAATGRRLFAADVEAFQHGPVVDSLRSEFNGRQIIDLDEHASVAHLTVPEDIDAFLKQVWVRFGDMSASQLRAYTHRQDPWKNHYYSGSFHERIPDAEMAAYYRDSVPSHERVFHPDAVVVTSGFLDELDEHEDEAVEKILAALGR